MGLSEFLFKDDEFFTAGMIIAPDDVFAIDDAVKIRDDDKSIVVGSGKIKKHKKAEQTIVHSR
jgi:hypothetical protein